MKPFLKQVASHYFATVPDISRLCFVFPNRRALRFFEHYLGGEIAASGKGPVVAPSMFTINDFFYHATGEKPSGRIPLLLELHSCYSKLNPGAEPLDDFVFWGDAILGDFDDIDKYLVNPEQLFTNVSDYREIQDDFSYLSDAQREAILRFIGHFRSPGTVKEGFLRIWRILLPLYHDFRSSLKEKGLSYEGMVYRELAGRLSEESAADILSARFPNTGRFVFVGLNALNECEKTLLRRMHKARLCEFCWDYRSDFIRNSDNKSSFFLADFVKEFPSAFETDPEGLPATEFNVLSVPGGIAQAKQLPQILSRCNPAPGIETAVVLPDENMLIPVLNTIPQHISKLNVTMGYPISGSQMWALISDLGALQLHLRHRPDGWYFYHRQVWDLASNSIIKSVLSEEGRKAVERVRKDKKYYISEAALKGDPVLDVLFRAVVTSPEADASQVRNLCSWMRDVLVTVAPRLRNIPGMELELDFAKVCCEALEDLGRYEMSLRPQSLLRLLGQTLGAATVPFEGEPLEGMQIMGPLELRAMDFETLVILSCNEGVFPRRSVSASFIPPELRKGFGLPTSEYQDAVWAYYFYRMIQRASKVWMVYDSRAEGLKGGEPSRYLRQLEMHFGVKINYFESRPALGGAACDESIPKTAEHIEKLHAVNLSASAVKTFLDCPAKFFYSKVEGLESEDEIGESLDAGKLGNVLHKTMEQLYARGSTVNAGFIDSLLRDKARIRDTVNGFICAELGTFDVEGRNIVLSDVICSYVEAILESDLAKVGKDGPFKVEDTEKKVKMAISGFDFVGFVDRLDRLPDGGLRVVDYKTGRVDKEDLDFGKSIDDIPKIGLQLYLYKRMLAGYAAGAPVEGTIVRPAGLMSGEEVISLDMNDIYCQSMEKALDRALAAISNTDYDWERTADEKKCEYCDFRAICGR